MEFKSVDSLVNQAPKRRRHDNKRDSPRRPHQGVTGLYSPRSGIKEMAAKSKEYPSAFQNELWREEEESEFFYTDRIIR